MNPNNNQSVQKSQDAAAASVFHPVENKNKSSAGGASGTAAPGTSAVAKNPATEASRQQEMEELRRLLNLKANISNVRNAPKNEDELLTKEAWKFWETQPVPSLGTVVPKGINEPIQPNKPIEEIRQVALTLPDGFKWDDVDLNNKDQLLELYTLLNENYVEDDDNMFRFDYSPEFLKWALQPSGWLKQWHVGVRVAKNNKLVGFISAVPAMVKCYEKNVKMVEINYLCVHKKLRAKRVAPVLIKEITRRVNLTGIFQAVYTAGVILPSPVSKCRYWHRSLNPKKLIEVQFSHLARNMTMQRTIKLYKLPEQPKTPGFRKLLPQDCQQAFRLLFDYLKNFDLSPIYSLEEFKHWFLPRDNVVDSFVVEQNGVITDFGSFYHLPSTIMNHPQHKVLKAAYSFYNVATKTPLNDLMNDMLVAAKNLDLDVFNALDLMDNAKFLENLKFGIGDGNLQYYIYNWKCSAIKPEKVNKT
jgi:glycylpeptide N-tetradecanoyltransferase